MTLLRAACFGLVTTAAIAVGLGGASAAPYQQSITGVCGAAAVCQIDFTPVPTAKIAELTNVSCYVSMGVTASIRRLQLQQVLLNNTAAVTISMPYSPYISGFGTPSALNLGVINMPVTLYATAGQKFRIRAELIGGSFRELTCHVSGRI